MENIELIVWYGILGILNYIFYRLAKTRKKLLVPVFRFFGILAIGIIIVGLVFPSCNPFN